MLRRAIMNYRLQTYPNRQLLILAESSDDQSAAVVRQFAGDPSIQFHTVDPAAGSTLGELRNLTINLAKTEYVAQWDDDDVSHPERLSLQLALILKTNYVACTLSGAVIYCNGRAVISERRPWEGSLLCKKSAHPAYPSLRRGEDTVVINQLVTAGKLIFLDRPELYLYIFHGGNTWDSQHFNSLVFKGRGPVDSKGFEVLKLYLEHEASFIPTGRMHNPIAMSYVSAFESLKSSPIEYPRDQFRGRGIVMVAGGDKYLPGAWVCINQLRRLRCTLSIEVWHLGPQEMDEAAKRLFESFDRVRCVDAFMMLEQHPIKTLRGWECKPYSILHSAFEEVLFLDADNFPLADPTYLFEAREYLKHGAVFWPDVMVMEPTRPIWRLLGVPYRTEPEFESGQMVVDKGRCWKALVLSCHLCEFGDEFWWTKAGGAVYGDKDLFRFAWHAIEQGFAMPSRPLQPLDGFGVLCQHDFEGHRVFQHRTWKKWKLYGGDERIEDFWFESECFQAIDSFRRRLFSLRQELQSQRCLDLARQVQSEQFFMYVRVGHDERLIEFGADGLIGRGSGRCERWWIVTEMDGQIVLRIIGEDGIMCNLCQGAQMRFEGEWLMHEKMPILVVPPYAHSGAR